jgi:type III restriction enzyme
MKLQFKKQTYQTDAVNAVVDCFIGQPNILSIKYRLDVGRANINYTTGFNYQSGFKNADVSVDVDVLANIKKVQQQQNLNISEQLHQHKSPCEINLNVEMETGTGKTYVYIKTIFELYERYGWSKFIIVVPSVAIREGIYKSLQITQNHFLEEYKKKIRAFIYNSKKLDEISAYSSDGGINVMIINAQAFNSPPSATAKQSTINNAKNKIYRELDSFQSRRPIDVIKANRPILILDEPQKLEGEINKPSQTIKALKEFNPLFVIRYSATHKINYNIVHRLDALDAYNQKLVKKINVRGITVKGVGGDSRIYLSAINVTKGKNPTAKISINKKFKSEIKEEDCVVSIRDNLYVKSNEVEAYKEGFIVTEIDANTNTVMFSNGIVVEAGKPSGKVDDKVLRRIQIREAIRAHFEKERVLFAQGIKVLSLFFIDSVAKYRDYEAVDNKGEYAKIFEQEYKAEYDNYLQSTKTGLNLNPEYQKYLDNIETDKTHNGYFSVDKKGNSINSKENDKSEKDVNAYDLILKNKERLLSFNEPTRFIFTHSALREGWDNPNVFVICALKHSDNTVSRRQEVGRGLRLAVNQQGERQDNPATVHQTNVLTVIANESYKSFVDGLQKDIVATLSSRPRIADVAYFKNQTIRINNDELKIDINMAQGIEYYLIQNGYINRKKEIIDKYHNAKKEDSIATLPEDLIEYKDEIFRLINSVFDEKELPNIDNDRDTKNNNLNANFYKKEFQELWNKINTKAIYQVNFDSNELINKAVKSINENLNVTKIQCIVKEGSQIAKITENNIKSGESFKSEKTKIETKNITNNSQVPYDLIGKITNETQLTRLTVAGILKNINVDKFGLFKENPEEFILNTTKLINEQKATTVVEYLSYDTINDKYDNSLFTNNNENINKNNLEFKPEKHVFDYVNTDSKIEIEFVKELDISAEVVVYSKLPRGFSIPTPVGNYNPDWAIAFVENKVKHIYFVAETKGSMQSLKLRGIENTKIQCAKKFFNELNKKIDNNLVEYKVVNNYKNLMKLVSL